MEKIIKIDGKDIPFRSTGAFMLRYKAQFGRDAIHDIFKLQNAMETEVDEKGREISVINDIDKLDLEVFYDLIWTLAKTADPTIDPPFEWLDQFGEFPLADIIPQIMDLVLSCLTTKAKNKKKV